MDPESSKKIDEIIFEPNKKRKKRFMFSNNRKIMCDRKSLVFKQANSDVETTHIFCPYPYLGFNG